MALISSQTHNSILYDTIADLGMLCTEERYIRKVREESNSLGIYEDLPLSIEDIDRIGYQFPHFTTKLEYEGKLEIWLGDRYVNPTEITWVKDMYHLYGVLNFDPGDAESVRASYNPGIVLRESYHKDGDAAIHTIIKKIDIRDDQFGGFDRPEQCAFFISNNRIYVPAATWLDDYTVQFMAQYTDDIDFFICNNLVGIFNAESGVGVYIDNPNSMVCYHHIVIDHDPTYHIDARFYPCITVDKDCTIRVYNDHYHRVSHPETTRLINYPEYSDVADPYNCDIEYLKNLKPVDQTILKTDSDDTIQKKFQRISQYCYRAWETFPKFTDEVSDFVVCDNGTFGKECFKRTSIYTTDEVLENVIYSVVPFEDHRDLLFYHGELFSDYRILNLTTTVDDKLVESKQTGVPTYVIPSEYELNDFVLVKFNAWEDTQFVNIGEYIDENLTATLYTKLNRFYRNMLVLRAEVLEAPVDEQVRVMTTEPSAKDEHLWFELLTNVNPDDFASNAPMVINLFGLADSPIPESIKTGAYKLDIDPKDGPVSYNEVLMTYYKLTESDKQYLALQYIGKDSTIDAGTSVYHSLKMGKPSDDAHVGDLVLSGNVDGESDTITSGDGETPEDPETGDMYMEMEGISAADLLAAPDTKSLIDQIGQPFTLEEISAYPRSVKTELISMYLNKQKDSMTEEDVAKAEYALTAYNESVIDETAYQIMKTLYIKDYVEKNDVSYLTLNMGDESESVEQAIDQNMTLIMSLDEPTDAEINDLWIEIDGFNPEKYIQKIISSQLIEGPTDSVRRPSADPENSTVVIDFGAHGDNSIDLFQEVTDETLHPVTAGIEPPMSPEDLDIWYEFLDEVTDKVCYFDENTMIIRVDERLLAIRFSDDSLQGFMFDDIVMNFRGKLGIKYLSLLADLINSGILKESDCRIFYKRLITSRDVFDLGLKRLYTGTSHVVATANVDTTDLSVIFSTNIGRYTVNYADEDVTNRERESAYRMCINYKRDKNFAYLSDRMLVFINGKYIPREDCIEENAYTIRITNFHEVISTVDILYSVKDEGLMKLKRAAFSNWPLRDTTRSFERVDKTYAKMEPFNITEQTKRGYYDILLNEYILNGKLTAIIHYLSEHPDEVETFKRDLVEKFHAISDINLGMTAPQRDPRIIISGNSTRPVYEIGGSNNE